MTADLTLEIVISAAAAFVMSWVAFLLGAVTWFNVVLV